MWRRIPIICAFVLLVWQVVLPWTVSRFVTTDGPAHLYGATVARDLAFHHQSSVYKTVYTIQRRALPNWTTTVALGAIGAVTGTEHAEKFFVSFLVALSFFGLCYFNRTLGPDASPWTPLMVVVPQTWFLFAGFYNFCLGMVLLPWLIAFHIGSLPTPEWKKKTGILAIGLIAIFFTHLIVAALAMAAVAFISMWQWIWDSKRRWQQLAPLLSLVPAALLILLYVHGAPPAAHLFEFAKDLRQFPGILFLTGQGPAGTQSFLRIFLMIYIAAGIVLMKGPEWRSSRGAVVFAIAFSFLCYLLIPDNGFGGSIVKIRFVWAVFVFGVSLAASVSRLRMLNVPIALLVSFFIAQNLIATRTESVKLSRAVESYLSATSAIPKRASIVRLNYAAPAAAGVYGYDGGARFPFFHLDSFAAARNNDIDLTDYEAPTGLFPLAFRNGTSYARYQLWGFEGPGPGDEKTLDWVRTTFPIPVDYVIVFGQEGSPDAVKQGMPQMLAYLDSGMQLVSTSTDHLLRIYRRR